MVFLALCVALLSFAARLEATRKLRRAVLHGDATTVRTLLTEGINPRERLVWRESSLELARKVARGNQHHPVLLLLEQRNAHPTGSGQVTAATIRK